MTPRQVQLIQSSWAAVEPIADQAATIFYSRLFELDPRVTQLFSSTDMPKQRKVLMQTLTVVVKGLNRIDQLVPAIEALGRRHVGYGVEVQDYGTVGDALIYTLEQGLGDTFTPEARAAWVEAYGLLATVMIAATEKTAEVAA